MSAEAGQQHPLGIYYKIWILLFVLSLFSYMVDYLDFQGYTRWTLIIIFMLLKAGFIVAIFMHAFWERMALVFTILGPPTVLLLLISFMAIEGEYTWGTRVDYMGQNANPTRLGPADIHGAEAGEGGDHAEAEAAH
jgi:cytochrome c oxidase subunit IV